MNRMNAAILLAPKQLEINRKAYIPIPGPGEVVVKVRAALTCGTDIKTFLRGHPKIPLPSPLGHEYSGDVFAVGEGVTGFAVGDAVMGVHTAPCCDCRMCRIGKENLCESAMRDKVLGAYAQYIKLPARIVRVNLFAKPETLSYAEAAMLEPLACVVHGAGLIHKGDETVLILGAGPIGLMHLMLAKAAGKKVIVAGRKGAGRRLEAAHRLGADIVIDSKIEDLPWAVQEHTDGLGADVVIEAAGSREIWEATPMLVRKGGSVLLFGGCPPDTKACFSASRLHYDEISLVGAFHFTPADVKVARELLVSGRIDVKPLISGEYPLDNLHEAFTELIAGNGIKFAIIP